MDVSPVLADSRCKFPYRWTHCCDKQLYLALCNYAELHNGRFPSGCQLDWMTETTMSNFTALDSETIVSATV